MGPMHLSYSYMERLDMGWQIVRERNGYAESNKMTKHERDAKFDIPT